MTKETMAHRIDTLNMLNAQRIERLKKFQRARIYTKDILKFMASEIKDIKSANQEIRVLSAYANAN